MLKPWYVFRPIQIIDRVLFSVASAPAGLRPIKTSVGVELWADPARAIGRSIGTTGVYDLAVSEAVVRLIRPGDTVLDVGANIGYMTMLAALAAQPAGKVFAFEAHPAIFDILMRNVSALSSRWQLAGISAMPVAIGDSIGETTLWVPETFAENEGVASLVPHSGTGGESFRVAVDTIDHLIGDIDIGLIKLDVEGAESAVLAGADRSLARHRVRHLIFEEHDIAGSRIVSVLERHGYQIFSLGWSLWGLQIRPVGDVPCLAKTYEAPSYIATIAPAEMHEKCAERGWKVLGAGLLEKRL